MREHLVRCFENQELITFPIYRQVSSRTTINLEDRENPTWKRPRRSARLSKKSVKSVPAKLENRFSALDSLDVDVVDSKETKEEPVKEIEKQVKTSAESKLSQAQQSNSKFTSIVNLSDTKLTEAEVNLLEKGLNFCVVDKTMDGINLLEDTYRFSRKIKLKSHFESSDKVKDPPGDHDETKTPSPDSTPQGDRADMKQIKNPYYNPTSTPPKMLEVYISAVKNSIKKLWKSNKNVADNLTQEERLALGSLKQREDIIIQQADKGGKTVLMNKEDYIKELDSMLEDEEYYKKENKDMTAKYSEEIREKVAQLDEYITKKERKYLVDDLDQPRTPVFYGLPKIHKLFDKLPPMRPIVSGFKSFTVKLSEFLDSFLKQRAQKCKSYIKDTNDFLAKLRDLKDLKANSILVTMDVSSLYTNIDQDEGTEACYESLEQRDRKSIPSLVLKDLIMLVLQRNIFRFKDNFYTQIKGTCMGTPMAPNYANIFMDKFEQGMLDRFYKKTGKRPLIWWRYIDDIFFIWNNDENSLNEFIHFAQTYSESQGMRSKINFTVNHSVEEVSFLDVLVKKKGNKLVTSVYSKPTDSHLYLSQQSNHPKHMIKNIPKSQFLRLRRICSDNSDFINQCSKYIKYFVNRGYDEKKLINAAKEVSQISRDEVLCSSRKKQDVDRVVFTCDWHPKLSQLPGMIKKHHHILQEDSKLKEVFRDPPIVAFRRAKTIRSQIVRSDVQPPEKIEGPTQTCGKCSICKIVSTADTLTNNKCSNKHLKITAGGTCRSSNIVYAARCKKCDLIYIGETGHELRTRFCDHRYDSKSRPDNNELAEHIYNQKHNFETDIEVCILKQGFKSPDERKYYEDKFICLLGTRDEAKLVSEKTGLNKKLGNYAKEMYHLHQELN